MYDVIHDIRFIALNDKENKNPFERHLMCYLNTSVAFKRNQDENEKIDLQHMFK